MAAREVAAAMTSADALAMSWAALSMSPASRAAADMVRRQEGEMKWQAQRTRFLLGGALHCCNERLPFIGRN